MASVKTILAYGFGLLAIANIAQANEYLKPTSKHIIDVDGLGDSYFTFGVQQKTQNLKPYITCVGEEACPQRTVKTLMQKKHPVAEVTSAPVNNFHTKDRVFFDFSRSGLSKNEKSHIHQIAGNFKSQHTIKLRAYTDPVGGINSPKNRKLAHARAEAVKSALIHEGIKAKFIIEYNPPCCAKAGVTAKSTDEERKPLRLVEIS